MPLDEQPLGGGGGGYDVGDVITFTHHDTGETTVGIVIGKEPGGTLRLRTHRRRTGEKEWFVRPENVRSVIGQTDATDRHPRQLGANKAMTVIDGILGDDSPEEVERSRGRSGPRFDLGRGGSTTTDEEDSPSDDAPLSEALQTKGYGSTDADFESPWRSAASEGLREKAEEAHAERSRQARTADAQYNAPVADSYAQWAGQPNRYDIPSVDTIPSDVRRERAQSLLDLLQRKGAVRKFEEVDPDEMGSTRGSHLAAERRIQMRADLEDETTFAGASRSFTLAHEGGHALDSAIGHEYDESRVDGDEEGFRFGELGWSLVGTYHLENLDDDPKHWDIDRELAGEFRTLSERARGEIDMESEYESTYRGQVNEMFADAVALSVLEPRAARREAPRAFDAIQREGFARLHALEDRDKRNEGSGNNSGDLEEFV